jgi:hypothetical protein
VRNGATTSPEATNTVLHAAASRLTTDMDPFPLLTRLTDEVTLHRARRD